MAALYKIYAQRALRSPGAAKCETLYEENAGTHFHTRNCF